MKTFIRKVVIGSVLFLFSTTFIGQASSFDPNQYELNLELLERTLPSQSFSRILLRFVPVSKTWDGGLNYLAPNDKLGQDVLEDILTKDEACRSIITSMCFERRSFKEGYCELIVDKHVGYYEILAIAFIPEDILELE